MNGYGVVETAALLSEMTVSHACVGEIIQSSYRDCMASLTGDKEDRRLEKCLLELGKLSGNQLK